MSGLDIIARSFDLDVATTKIDGKVSKITWHNSEGRDMEFITCSNDIHGNTAPENIHELMDMIDHSSYNFQFTILFHFEGKGNMEMHKFNPQWLMENFTNPHILLIKIIGYRFFYYLYHDGTMNIPYNDIITLNILCADIILFEIVVGKDYFMGG